MEQRPPPDEQMVVATPELVAFSYELSGLGSRFLAALLDLAVVAAIALVAGTVAVVIVAAGQSNLGVIIGIVAAFVLIYGYFWACEYGFNGQTLGKKATRLRVVGENGEPITFTQAGVRNLIRLVDFLPAWYGVGLVTIFVNGRGRRLGDLAAGTVVVRERHRVKLQDLPVAPAAPPPGAPGLPAPARLDSWAVAVDDPLAKRFLTAYAIRRPVLDESTRRRLADQVLPLLQRWAPDVLASQGPAAALDALAFRSLPSAPPPPPPPGGAPAPSAPPGPPPPAPN